MSQYGQDNASFRESEARHKWYRNKLLVFIILFLIADAILLGFYIHKHHNQPAVSNTNTANAHCATTQGPFTVHGTQVLQADGKQYIPYGTTVEGLSGAKYTSSISLAKAQIQASVGAWCSNTIRFQVAPDNLLGTSGTGYSAAYMNTLKSLVGLAEQAHMIVVICAQTESLGKEPGPIAETALFWKDITKVYGNNPQVVYDLFNEPRVGTKITKGDNRQVWHTWQQGGTFQGQTYVGMQPLVNDVRADGAKNLLWVEGPYTASTLKYVQRYPVTGGPLMYAIHHPKGAHNTKTWDNDFGFLINRHVAPVVDGEWSNWAANHGECWKDAPTAVPQYLSYLQRKHIGMTVWTLQKGVMSASSTDLSIPTQIKSDWQCKNGLDEGAGSLVMSWFKQNNSV